MTNSPTSSAADVERAGRECKTHGEYIAKVIRMPFQIEPLFSRCPKCEEESESRRKREAELQAVSDRAMRLRSLHSRSGVPARFQSATIDGYADTVPGQKRVREACRRYIDGFEQAKAKGASIVMCGRPGTGKTHLACAIANAVIDQYLASAEFYTVLNAIRSIKDTYRKDSDRSETQAIDALLEPSLLVLDEIGIQVGSEHEKMLIFEIINERYQNCRPTILISNLSADELTAYLGERVMDRFRECGGILAFDWQSHRGVRA